MTMDDISSEKVQIFRDYLAIDLFACQPICGRAKTHGDHMFNFLFGVAVGGAIVWIAKETVRDLFRRAVAGFKKT